MYIDLLVVIGVVIATLAAFILIGNIVLNHMLREMYNDH